MSNKNQNNNNFYPNIHNNCSFQGRIASDIKSFSNDNVAKFTLAVDKGLSKSQKQALEKEGKPTADFLYCVAFGFTAQKIIKFFSKGAGILVSAKFENNDYIKDGETVRGYQFVVTDWGFPLSNGSSNGSYDSNSSSSSSTVDKTKDFADDDFSDFSSVEDDDDIPF